MLNRRNWIRLGGSAIGAFTLPLDAMPTEATEDSHNYLEYIEGRGMPEIVPEGKFAPSHTDILGPYYAANAPFRGKMTAPLEPGEMLVVRGRIWSFETKKPIPNALLDVWQADAKGNYDKKDAADRLKIKDFKNRIRLLADETGYYEYETIKPGQYKAGKSWRPSHIHYLVRAAGHKQVITQLYFKGDKYNQTDTYAKKSPMIVDPEIVTTPNGKYLRATFDIVLAGGVSDEMKGGGKDEKPGAYVTREIVTGDRK